MCELVTVVLLCLCVGNSFDESQLGGDIKLFTHLFVPILCSYGNSCAQSVLFPIVFACMSSILGYALLL